MGWVCKVALTLLPFSDLLCISHLSHSASSLVPLMKYSILHTRTLSWELDSMECLPERRGLNSAETSHSHRTCEAVSAWVF
jgi:hypothetical protein